LTTTFEIRWDRIALGERAGLETGAIHELVPVEADLQWHGFSQLEVRRPGHPKTPDHDVVFERPPWRTVQQGWCTRYGDVRELVVETDDQLAILNAGDEVTLRFDADSLPPIPPDHARTFFLYTFGWEKDGDHNVVGGDFVGPLPSRQPLETAFDDLDENDWQLKYNTRWISRDRFRPTR
jgi:hypothetical protein